MAIPNEHVHFPFLTKMIVLVGNLGFQSITNHYQTPCTTLHIFLRKIDFKAMFGRCSPEGRKKQLKIGWVSTNQAANFAAYLVLVHL